MSCSTCSARVTRADQTPHLGGRSRRWHNGRVTADQDPHVLGPDLAPTPFTADEIRAGCPDGRRIRMAIEVDGELVGYRTNRFYAVDRDGASLESARFDASGVQDGPSEAGRVTWLELQRHAAFPAARATIEPETIETPMGPLECLRYSVPGDDGTDVFWFARAIPGMPIRYETIADGRVRVRVTVIENELPPA